MTKKIYIPLGVDCTVARFLANFGERTQSLPFDWLVTYLDYASLFENNFEDFYSRRDLLTPHGWPPERRVTRLLNILEDCQKDGTQIVFIRKSHSEHHHGEYGTYHLDNSETTQAHRLDRHLSQRYPQLNYKIFLFLTCDLCETAEYKSNTLVIRSLVGIPSNDKPTLELTAYADVLEFEIYKLIIGGTEEAYSFECDSPIETYNILQRYAAEVKDLDGLSCEVGLRKGAGTFTIMNAYASENSNKIHICLDPYGNILYSDIAGVHRCDYTNNMRNDTLSEIYRFASNKKLNILFFNLEDSEFYKRFQDGVPVYDQEKKLVNVYCFVHIDGQHDFTSVKLAAEFFVHRTVSGGILIFDNTDHYNHEYIDKFLIENDFEYLETAYYKKAYRKR